MPCRKDEGFEPSAWDIPKESVEAIRRLTHDQSVPYLDYVASLRDNPIAVKVKIADLTHNSDLTRLPTVTQEDLDRREKYLKAMKILEEQPWNAPGS